MPRYSRGIQTKLPVQQLGKIDQQDKVIYCGHCKGPVVESKIGIMMHTDLRRHAVGCAAALRSVGWTASGDRVTERTIDV